MYFQLAFFFVLAISSVVAEPENQDVLLLRNRETIVGSQKYDEPLLVGTELKHIILRSNNQ